MKTMFGVQNTSNKKRFQKPNILRKRPKPPRKASLPTAHESPSVNTLVISPSEEPKSQLDKTTVFKQSSIKSPVQKCIYMDSNIDEQNSISDMYQIDGNLDTDSSLAVTCEVLTNNNDENVFETTINVESFINNSDMELMVSQADVDNELSSRMKQEWCLDFINDAQEIVIEDIDGSHLGSLRLASPAGASNAAPSAADTSSEQTTASATPAKNLTLEYLNCTMNYKCDVPNCTKRFRSEQALSKHKSSHTKGVKVGNKSNKQVVIECPVKKVTGDGHEEPCSYSCSTKDDMVKHLNESHNPEDAMYICSECSRRFYWAAGLRAHVRAHAAARARELAVGALVCAWPGCARAFRQPCRLREHMRAHTGDKPYPCRHPNCGWSFRTASKLLRHARRHTGERRHTCAACNRAFRRREHLRDHHARYHVDKHACPHAGCQKKFTSVETLRTHMEMVHKSSLVLEPTNEEGNEMSSVGDLTRNPSSYDAKTEDIFVSRLETPESTEPTGAPLEVEQAALNEVQVAPSVCETTNLFGWQRAARTHCTWPFPATPSPATLHEYVLEEDVQVEGSESNIYTIRSDLFLHGNLLINEDSEQMCGSACVGEGEHGSETGVGGGEGGTTSSRSLLLVDTEHAPLSLLDHEQHPTSGLMQEELMYTDAAVDESTFRVFLLSGEELS